jgi:nucleoside-diphosphate-sugar epimerase
MHTISILGCGWLGKALGSDLSQKGYSIFGSTTRKEKCDELRAAGIAPFVINFQPQVTGDHVEEFFKRDVLVISIPPKIKSGGTENFVKQMVHVRESIRRYQTSKVVFISSTSVYADLNKVVYEEDADPSSPLMEAEKIFQNHPDFQVVILRFAGLVGPGRHPGRFLAGKKNLRGGNNPVNIIHQQDCIEIIRKIISGDIWNEIFNACADQHPAKKDFYSVASKLLQLDPPEFIDEGDTPFKIISAEKLKQTFSYQFQYPDPLGMLS